ncbi:MAG: DUF3306 domain-containing protein [Betaproteobacteria bacterium]|nr:DUF3306 domain-containing protein [Betaproteobacteria bacterium]
MAGDQEAFLSRWSRVKRETLAEAAKPAPVAPAAEVPEAPLPPVDQLDFESDFTVFMKSKVVEEGVKRAALKKLFADPRFNVQDGLDTYIDDYSIEDPIPPDLLEQLQHAKRTLFGPQPEKPETAADPEASGQPQAQADLPVAEEPKAHGDRG